MKRFVPCWLRSTIAAYKNPVRCSNQLVLAGFAAITVGAGLIYVPAGFITAGVLAVVLAKLIADSGEKEDV